MIIAAQKKKENIAEYILYMYQVEDMIRANKFNLDLIEQTIINKFDADYGTRREMREWYKDLIERLQTEGKTKQGHMTFLEKIIDELNELNLKLLHDPLNSEFKVSYDRAKTNIEALRMKSGHSKESDVCLAFNGLYGYLILRLQKKEISSETEDAFKKISDWLARLSDQYMS